MNPDPTQMDGPSQSFEAPDTLIGRVIDWRDGGAIHGIGVVDDLARNYAVHETFLLALTGEPPDHREGRAFGASLTWIAAAHIGTAPTHAAILARISGAPPPNLFGIVALTAGREAEQVLRQHAPLLDRLRDQRQGRAVVEARAGSEGWRCKLGEASGLDIPALDAADSATSAALIVFHHLGVIEPAQIVAAWVWARMIGATGEAFAEPALDMRSYPLRLPVFEYEESAR